MKSTKRLAIRNNTGLKIIDYNDILYCRGDGRYTWIYLRNGDNVLSAKVLKDFEDLLPVEIFHRVHKSSIINISCVVSYDTRSGGNITLENGHSISIAKRRKREFQERMLDQFEII